MSVVVWRRVHTFGSVEVTYDTLPPTDYTEPEPDFDDDW